jgi:hypothetical protein
VQGDLASKLDNLTNRYSGIVLAESAGSLGAQLLERLVHAQFQETRVYTLESFYETQWRYLPLGIVDPFWPLQTGFQLARTSPITISNAFSMFLPRQQHWRFVRRFHSYSGIHLDGGRRADLVQTGESRTRRKSVSFFSNSGPCGLGGSSG